MKPNPTHTAARGLTALSMSALRRLAIIPPVLLGAALVWFAAATSPAPPEVAPVERRAPVSFITATPRAFVPTVSGYGTVEPARVWNAVAEVAGAVVYLHPAFERGGFVTAGDVLVRIASEDYELAHSAAEADLRTAEARVEEMEVTAQTTKASLEIERESLNFAESDLARAMRLAETGVMSESAVETRRRDVLTQRSKVQNLENTLAVLPAQIEALENAAAAAWYARLAADLDLARTVVQVPFDARVARVDVEISQFVGVGASIGMLDGANAVEIDVQLSQQRLAELVALAPAEALHAIEVGAKPAPPIDPVKARKISTAWVGGADDAGPSRLTARIIQGDAIGGGAWPAEVSRISDTVSAEARSIGVILRVPEPFTHPAGDRLPPLIKGMFVRADLQSPPVADMILIPRSAISNGRVMLIDTNDRLTYAPADPVFAADGVAALAPGALPKGVRIITSEPSPAIEGLLLAPQPDLAAEARLQAASSGAPQ